MGATVGTEYVRSKEDLAFFLVGLAADLRAGRVVENRTSIDLLEGASGWIRDMDGYFANRGETPPSSPSWELIAMIFAAALVYE